MDPLGFLLMVVVTAAPVQDRDGATPLLERLRPRYRRLRPIGADGASTGPLVQWVKGWRPQRPLRLEITTRSDLAKGFVVMPKRWMVERPCGWCNRDRRLSQDDERLPATSAAVIPVTMIHLMIRRLARIAPY